MQIEIKYTYIVELINKTLNIGDISYAIGYLNCLNDIFEEKINYINSEIEIDFIKIEINSILNILTEIRDYIRKNNKIHPQYQLYRKEIFKHFKKLDLMSEKLNSIYEKIDIDAFLIK